MVCFTGTHTAILFGLMDDSAHRGPATSFARRCPGSRRHRPDRGAVCGFVDAPCRLRPDLPGTADERILEMLAGKAQFFDIYARLSEAAEMLDVVAMTEAQLAPASSMRSGVRLGLDGGEGED